jgi:hypothetical protein
VFFHARPMPRFTSFCIAARQLRLARFIRSAVVLWGRCETTLANLQTLCETCNGGKSDLRWKLKPRDGSRNRARRLC